MVGEKNRKRLSISAAELLKERKEQEFLVDGFLPQPLLGLLCGDGGVGKTHLAMQLAVSVSEGVDFLGLKTRKSRVLYVSADDWQNHLAEACQRIIDALDVKILIGALRFITLSQLREVAKVKLIDIIATEAKDYELIILDSLIDLFSGDENSNEQASSFMGEINQRLVKEERTVLLLHHITKPNITGKREIRGASAFKNSARLVYLLEEKKQNQLELKLDKTNFERFFSPLSLKRTKNGILMPNHKDHDSQIKKEKPTAEIYKYESEPAV